ncbi:MAG: Fic family protein [Lewinellaceae bacterium]|nr:Fic family protein [Lewinellaceae bacterium]
MDMPNGMDKKLEFGSKKYLQLSKLLSLIDTFKGAWQEIEHKEARYLKELRQMATVASVGSSTRIEGAKMTDAEIGKLLKSVKINKLERRDEQEVVGYYDALQVILENYQDIELSERYIHQLHGILLKHSNKDQAHKGGYKQLSNKVVANYPDGTQKVIFNTTEPHLTQGEIQQLLAWTTGAIKAEEIHPLIIVGAFVYEFLSIHPYQDGNGRLSRLLTTLLLIQQGYAFVQYISFEHVIELRKDEYYKALMHGQMKRYTDDEKIDEWLTFFLGCMIDLTKRLEQKYLTYSKIKLELNERQKSILAFIKQEKTTKVGAIEKALSGESRNTIKKDLSYLLKEGLILRTGSGRGVQYHHVDEEE